MNYMFDFSPRELNLMAMAVMFLGAQVEGDNDAPEELLPTLHSIHNKIGDVMNLRLQNEEQFNQITKQLPDLLSTANDVIKEMENN